MSRGETNSKRFDFNRLDAARYCRSIKKPQTRDCLHRVLAKILNKPKGKQSELPELIASLPERRRALLFMIGPAQLAGIPENDLEAILRRYPPGNQKIRSRWRLLCEKYKVKAPPRPGVSLDSQRYAQKLYARTRSPGGRLDFMLRAHEILEYAVKHDLAAYEYKDIVEEVHRLCGEALKRGKRRKRKN